jgi:ATP-dependent DNA ligase
MALGIEAGRLSSNRRQVCWQVRLYSRNSKPFDKKFAYIIEALRELRDATTVDGEMVVVNQE